MPLRFDFDQHPVEDLLEKYIFDRMDEVESAPLEEHLLICEACRIRLTETGESMITIREAARVVAAGPGLARNARPFWPVWAVGFAALAIVLGLRFPMTHVAQPREVRLSVTRGAAESYQSRAPAGTPLVLVLDLTEVAPSPRYNLELVNASGALLWRATLPSTEGRLRAEVPPRLRTGQYWVRLYLPTKPPSLLREYGLEVR